MNRTPVTPTSLTVNQCSDLQSKMRKLGKREAIDLLIHRLPHVSASWARRNLSRIQSLDPRSLHSFLTYADPTGEKAVRRT